MSDTLKPLSTRDSEQTLKHAYNSVDGSLTTNGFLTGLVGRKITLVNDTTTILNDTLLITFSESGTNLYTLKLIFTDGSQSTLMSAERIS